MRRNSIGGATLDGFTVCRANSDAIEGDMAGAVVNENASPTFVRCIFYESELTVIYFQGSSGSISYCTIVSTASKTPSGTTMIGTSPGNVHPTIDHSIVWGRGVATISPNLDIRPTRCVLDGGYLGDSDTISDDPLLLLLGYYGGAPPTIPLSQLSSAIDTGVPGAISPLSDQRVFARSYVTDIGATEAQSLPEHAHIQTAHGVLDFPPGKTASLEAYAEGEILSYQWYV
jgi:hypothetical protein